MASTLRSVAPGLRGRQKQDRAQRILKAARLLFDRNGYGATAMEEVADQAGLAVGTIYNYFPSKNDLLVAIMKREAERLSAIAGQILARPDPQPFKAISQMAELFVDSITAEERPLWREVFAAAITQPDTLGQRLFELDARLITQITALIEKFRRLGVLAADVESQRAATLVYALCLTWGMAFIMSDQMDQDLMRREIRKGLEIIMRGMLPRVSAQAARAAKESRQ